MDSSVAVNGMHAHLLVDGQTQALNAVAVSARTPRQLFIPEFPGKKITKRAIKNWREETVAEIVAAIDAPMPEPEDPRFTLPSQCSYDNSRHIVMGREKLDVRKTIQGIGLCRKLKSSRMLHETFAEAVELNSDSEAGDAAVDDVPATSSRGRSSKVKRKLPQGGHVMRSRLRLDTVSMNLQRRMFAFWKLMGVLLCINVFSDASPVTGREMQGMILECCFVDGTYLSLVLPGCVMAWGCNGAPDKAFVISQGCLCEACRYRQKSSYKH